MTASGVATASSLSLKDRNPVYWALAESGVIGVAADTMPDEVRQRLQKLGELLAGQDRLLCATVREYAVRALRDAGFVESGRLVEAALLSRATPTAASPLNGYTDLEILAQPDSEWTVDGVLPKGGLGMLVGRWGAGKTFLILDWTMHLAAGMAWCGRRVLQGPVLYLYAEGQMKPRVAAWRAAHRVEPDTTMGVTFIPGMVNLLDAAAVGAFSADIMAGAYGPPPVLIAVETLSRMTPGGDENSPETAGLVLAACGELQRTTGATLLLSHHTPWNPDQQRPRGHTKIPDAADALFLLENTAGNLKLTCQKMRDGEAPDPIHLKLTPQDAALVVDRADAPPSDVDRLLAAYAAGPRTDDDVAEELGVSARTIGRWRLEAGHRLQLMPGTGSRGKPARYQGCPDTPKFPGHVGIPYKGGMPPRMSGGGMAGHAENVGEYDD